MYSLRRQLTQVWRLTTNEPPGDVLIPALNAALLTKLGGSIELFPGDVSETSKQVENARTKGGHLRKRPVSTVGLVQARPGSLPCRGPGGIDHRSRGRDRLSGSSRGFLPGRWGGTDPVDEFSRDLSRRQSDTGSDHAVRRAGQLRGAGWDGQICKVGELLWTSPPDKLDATFVTLKGDGTKT